MGIPEDPQLLPLNIFLPWGLRPYAPAGGEPPGPKIKIYKKLSSGTQRPAVTTSEYFFTLGAPPPHPRYNCPRYNCPLASQNFIHQTV